MTLKTFVGGVNPRENKEETKSSPIEIILPGKELVYPLSGKVGTPAKATVRVGDKVLAGQKIAKADGFFSVPVHSAVSGKVVGIKKRTIFTGEQVRSIIIENDGLYDEVEYPAPKPLRDISNSDIIARIHDAGIVGLSGSGYPTHIKLSPPNPDKVSHIIVNGAECEPYLASDYRLMLEEPDRLLGGIKILLKLFPYARAIIAIADNMPDCYELLNEKIKKETRISVRLLKNKYPQGAERQIITSVTGKYIDSSILPSELGIVLLNVETVISVLRAVYNGKNLTSRIVTIAGNAIGKPRNFSVRLGSSFDAVIEAAGGFVKEPVKIICGGTMMGHALVDTNVPVTKLTSSLLCFTNDEVNEATVTACINCLKCASACPERLLPLKLAKFSKYDDNESFLSHSGMECTKCGCCSYICPAKINLTELIVAMKGKNE